MSRPIWMREARSLWGHLKKKPLHFFNCFYLQFDLVWMSCVRFLMPPIRPERGGNSSSTSLRTMLIRWQKRCFCSYLISYGFWTSHDSCPFPGVFCRINMWRSRCHCYKHPGKWCILDFKLTSRPVICDCQSPQHASLPQRTWRCPAQITPRGTESASWRISWRG